MISLFRKWGFPIEIWDLLLACKIKNHDMQKSQNWFENCLKNFFVAFRRVSRTSLTSLKRNPRAELSIFDFAYHDFLKIRIPKMRNSHRHLRFIANNAKSKIMICKNLKTDSSDVHKTFLLHADGLLERLWQG